jgi:hypothetical protein
VQIVLVALSVFLGWLTVQSVIAMTSPKASGFASIGKAADTGIGEIIFLAFFTVVCLAGALAMGWRIVRGPTPPEL